MLEPAVRTNSSASRREEKRKMFFLLHFIFTRFDDKKSDKVLISTFRWIRIYLRDDRCRRIDIEMEKSVRHLHLLRHHPLLRQRLSIRFRFWFTCVTNLMKSLLIERCHHYFVQTHVWIRMWLMNSVVMFLCTHSDFNVFVCSNFFFVKHRSMLIFQLKIIKVIQFYTMPSFIVEIKRKFWIV